MRTFYLMLCAFLAQGIMCFMSAQNENTVQKMPELTLPSPQSYAFQQFKGFEPDFATGAVNVNIPLHTLTHGNFSLPITLSYKTNGIKVGDPVKPLGYGWMLHPGLRITRTIMGKADETHPDKDYMNEPVSDSLLWSAYMGHANKDTQYDIFTLSLPERNVRFLLRNTSTVSSPSWEVLSLTNPYKIMPLYTNHSIYAFRVLDDKGNEYYFGKTSAESGVNDYVEVAEASSDMTAYFLRKVTLPDGEEISFTWTSHADMYSYVFALAAIKLDYLYQFNYGESDTSDDLFDVSDEITSYLSVGTYQTCSLASIQSSKFKVQYTYSNGCLQSILISDGNNQPVKPIVFDVYDNLLQSVTINGDEVYSFEYDPQRFDDSQNDVFRAVDYWGYYTGRHNERMYPSLTYTYYAIIGADPSKWSGRSTSVVAANLIPDETKAKANILKKIIYPTGGYSEYEYEMHRYNRFTTHSPYPMKMNKGGGLRIRSVTAKASDAPESVTIRKEYRYGPNESGFGLCTVEPNENTFVRESFYQEETDPGLGYSYRQLAIMPESMVSWYFMFAEPVWYDHVVEYVGETKTEYVYKYDFIDQLSEYDYPDEILLLQNTNSPGVRLYSDNVMDFPFSGLQFFNNLSGQGPLLMSRILYAHINAGYRKIRSESYTYVPYYLKNPHMYSLCNMSVEPVNSHIAETNSWDDQYAYLRSVVNPCVYLKSEDVTQEYGYVSGSVLTRTNYLYDDYGNIRHIERTNSAGDVVMDEYLYSDSSLDLLSGMGSMGFTTWMQSANHLTAPVGYVRKVNDQVTFRMMTSYLESDYVLPVKEFYDYGDGVQQRLSYERYNSHGRIQYLIKDGMEKTVILWGYGSEHPVAVIRNASYAQVENILGTAVIARMESAVVLSESDRISLNALRNALPDAMVDTYTYKPLVGVTSHTDASGLEIQYEYDSSERLSGVWKVDRTTGNRVRLERYEYNLNNVLEL